MGKSRGKGKYRGGKGRGDDEDSEEEVVGGQSATVGLLPPSDSESDEDESETEAPPKTDAAAVAAAPSSSSKSKPAAKPAKSAKPAKGDDGDDEDEDEDEESDDEPPMPEYLTQTVPKKKVQTEERDPDEIRKDLERLELVRKRREDDRLKRIRDEGWDRYAAVTETNKPPGTGTGPPPGFDA